MKKIIFLILILIIFIIIFNTSYIEGFNNKYKKVLVTVTKPIYEKKILSTGSSNSLYNDYGNMLSKIYPLYTITSAGSYENILNLKNKKCNFAIAQEDVVYDAIFGKNFFKRPDNNIRLISPLFEETIYLVTRPESNIKSWQDLRGKNVCFGKKGSGSLYVGIEICKLIGILPSDMNIYYEYQFGDNVKKMFVNRTLDAAVIITHSPNDKIQKLLKSVLLNLVGMDTINENLIKMRFPMYNRSKIIVSDYNIPSRKKEINTYSVKAVLITNYSENLQTVFKLIESIFNNTIYIRNNIKNKENYEENLSRFQISRYFPDNNALPLHDGVYNYYRNIGMITNNPNKKCSLFAGSGNCNLNIINYYDTF